MDIYAYDHAAAAQFLRDLADIFENTPCLTRPIVIGIENLPIEVTDENGYVINYIPPNTLTATLTVSWDLQQGGMPTIKIGEDTHGTNYFVE